MDLTRVEKLLNIVIPDESRETYQARLDAAIEHINGECGGVFGDSNVTVTLPAGVEMGAALLVKYLGENHSVSSQSLGDMSKSFFEAAGYKAAREFWKRHRKARFF